jgi:hypothetical protein
VPAKQGILIYNILSPRPVALFFFLLLMMITSGSYIKVGNICHTSLFYSFTKLTKNLSEGVRVEC